MGRELFGGDDTRLDVGCPPRCPDLNVARTTACYLMRSAQKNGPLRGSGVSLRLNSGSPRYGAAAPLVERPRGGLRRSQCHR